MKILIFVLFIFYLSILSCGFNSNTNTLKEDNDCSEKFSTPDDTIKMYYKYFDNKEKLAKCFYPEKNVVIYGGIQKTDLKSFRIDSKKQIDRRGNSKKSQKVLEIIVTEEKIKGEREENGIKYGFRVGEIEGKWKIFSYSYMGNKEFPSVEKIGKKTIDLTRGISGGTFPVGFTSPEETIKTYYGNFENKDNLGKCFYPEKDPKVLGGYSNKSLSNILNCKVVSKKWITQNGEVIIIPKLLEVIVEEEMTYQTGKNAMVKYAFLLSEIDKKWKIISEYYIGNKDFPPIEESERE
jgi:hypothetical protein